MKVQVLQDAHRIILDAADLNKEEFQDLTDDIMRLEYEYNKYLHFKSVLEMRK